MASSSNNNGSENFSISESCLAQIRNGVMQSSIHEIAEYNHEQQKVRKRFRSSYYDPHTKIVQVPLGKNRGPIPFQPRKVNYTDNSQPTYPVPVLKGQYVDQYVPFTPWELTFLPVKSALHKFTKKLINKKYFRRREKLLLQQDLKTDASPSPAPIPTTPSQASHQVSAPSESSQPLRRSARRRLSRDEPSEVSESPSRTTRSTRSKGAALAELQSSVGVEPAGEACEDKAQSPPAEADQESDYEFDEQFQEYLRSQPVHLHINYFDRVVPSLPQFAVPYSHPKTASKSLSEREMFALRRKFIHSYTRGKNINPETCENLIVLDSVKGLSSRFSELNYIHSPNLFQTSEPDPPPHEAASEKARFRKAPIATPSRDDSLFSAPLSPVSSISSRTHTLSRNFSAGNVSISTMKIERRGRPRKIILNPDGTPVTPQPTGEKKRGRVGRPPLSERNSSLSASSAFQSSFQTHPYRPYLSQYPSAASEVAGTSTVCGFCGGEFQSDHLRSGVGAHPVTDPLRCYKCFKCYHPTCLEYSPAIVQKIRTYAWSCVDCKKCMVCNDPGDEERLMFCDACDRAYHNFCVGLDQIPTGDWKCVLCLPTA